MRRSARLLPTVIRPLLGDLSWALVAQILLIVANLCNGVLLARGTPLELRGFIVLFSVGLTLLTAVATFGVPDLLLHYGAPGLERRLVAIALAIAAFSGMLGALCAVPPQATLSLAPWAAAAGLASASMSNSILFSVILVRRGVRLVSVLRCGYALAVVASMAIAYAVSGGRLAWMTVLTSMLVAEVVTTLALAVCTRLPASASSSVPPLGVRVILREGPRYLAASLGTAATQRGVLLLASIFGGLPATALLSVAQNAASPISIPVSALAAPIQHEASKAPEDRTAWVSAAVGLTICAAALTIPINYWLLVPLYGDQYTDLQGLIPWISLFGALSALWRIQHGRLRGVGRPIAALLTDIAGLFGFAATAVLIGLDESAQTLVPAMCGYAGIGLCASYLAETRRQGYSRRPRDEVVSAG